MFRLKVSDWIDGALTRLVNALTESPRRERNAGLLLAAYCLAWTLYGAVAKSSQDIHFDMGEMVAWAREIALGTPKHPPMGSWLVWLWFSIFPRYDWSYYLFAMVLATFALWVAWKISALFLTAEKRVAALALMTLIPFYNFHALKFNANTVMTPFWALATWTFLRSYQTRNPAHAALAGLAAAAAMLAKYWSLILLAGLGIAALADPRRDRYFGAAAPWLTIAFGAMALTPHVVWLIANGSPTVAYAMDSHPGTVWGVLASGPDYVAGALAYIAVPIAIAAIAARPGRAAIADTLWPADPDRRFVVLAFALPLLLPFVAALATQEKPSSLWAISAITLLGTVLLSSPLVKLSQLAVKRIVAVAVALPLAALLASPVIAVAIHRHGLNNDSDQYRLVAQAVERQWRSTTDKPLKLVGGIAPVSDGAIFYTDARPSIYEPLAPERTPWVDPARLKRDGIALVCPVTKTDCVDDAEARAKTAPGAKRSEITLARSYLGIPGKPQRYLIVTIPPQ